MRPCLYQPDLVYRDGALVEAALAVDANGRLVDPKVLPPDAETIRLEGRVAFPGLVNAHSHGFQRLIRGRTEFVPRGRAGDDFWSWREQMYRAAESLEPEGVYVASRQAFVEMALGGVSAVGEFHYLHHQADGTPYADPDELAHQVIRAARDVGIRIALLRVGYARSGFEVAPNPRQRRFIDAGPERLLSAAERLAARYKSDDGVRVGLAPHSVRAVTRSWLEVVAQESRWPLHMHVSEQPAEIAACLREHGRRPVQLLEELGLLGPRFTGVHAIHLDEGEVAALGRARAFVCACPTTERNLGDGVVPADALVRAGARVCLGSDSHAQIDLLEEARALEADLRLLRLKRCVLDPGGGEPSGLARALLDFASGEGAESLGFEGGALKPGAPADFFTLDASHPSVVGASGDSAAAALLLGAEKAAVRELVVQGRLVVRDGRHPLQEESARAFSALSRKVFG